MEVRISLMLGHRYRYLWPFVLIIIVLLEFSQSAPIDDQNFFSNSDEFLLEPKNLLPQLTKVGNFTRQHAGDVFDAIDAVDCDTDTCVGMSSGTAGLYQTNGIESDIEKKSSRRQNDRVHNTKCKCQCLPHLPTYRDDTGICVDDLHECTLASFTSGSSAEKIPFVFLPLRGQIIHPSKEISFTGIKSPLCTVSSSQYLSTKGWTDLRNPLTNEIPFRLYIDEGRTFLQWLGEPELRQRMQGRLIIIHLLCHAVAPASIDNYMLEEVENTDTLDNGSDEQPKVFTPCVGIRVAGTPTKHNNNVTEVSFQSEIQADLSVTSTSDGLTTKEYIVIAVCSLLLGLIYVASVLLYLHVKKRKIRSASSGSAMNTIKDDINYPPNDQVTFGNGFNRTGSTFSNTGHGNMLGARGMSHQNSQRSSRRSNGSINEEEMNIVKSNPLLKHYPNLSDNSGFISDMSNSNSECDDDRRLDAEQLNSLGLMDHFNGKQFSMDSLSGNSSQEQECLPEENVSIVEDMNSDDKIDNIKALVNGTLRRKLYFNPAYFEPHLLAQPPPAAVEFLTKIREVITIAKYKMAAKRYQPSLNVITEESGNQIGSTIYGSETYTNPTAIVSRQGSQLSLKHENSKCKSCTSHESTQKCQDPSSCNNCGDKRNSIQKWLETVPTHGNVDPQNSNYDDNNLAKKILNKTSSSDGSSASDTDTIKANSVKSKESVKRKPPPLPPTAPRILSHFLKPEQKQEQKSAPVTVVSEPKPTTSSQESKSDKNNLYNHLSKIGNEIYNNPQFRHGSPQQSVRSRCSNQSSRSQNRKKQQAMEILDQYANPKPKHYEDVMRNIHQMPDMVYEALAKDYTQQRNMQTFERKIKIGDSTYGLINLPTPDYDSYPRKPDNPDKDFYVPTPDYNTYGRTRSQKQIQPPDSPIYHRKSPHHLIVDYETDSLERNSTNKNIRNTATPPTSNNSDLSSQPSPSLSTALPLEEEMEIRNAVYDEVEGFRKDFDFKQKNESTVEKIRGIYEAINFKKTDNIPPYSKTIFSKKTTNDQTQPRIKYNTPFHGSMTIEVEHNPTDVDPSTDSDQFEPDTLDRKPKKPIQNPVIKNFNNFNRKVMENNVKNNNLTVWSQNILKQAQQHQKQKLIDDEFTDIHLTNAENITSLPDLNYQEKNNKTKFVLKSSGSFKSNSISNSSMISDALNNSSNFNRNFGSLREIYEAKNLKNMQRPSLSEIDFMEDGRILTLEERHARRQRTSTIQKNKKVMPPDVIPHDKTAALYDKPKPPIPLHQSAYVTTKTLNGWSIDDTVTKLDSPDDDNYNSCETNSCNSEGTQITGVSDIQPNSEFETVCLTKPKTMLEQYIELDEDDPSGIENDQVSESSTIKPNKSESRTNGFTNEAYVPETEDDDPNKIEVMSTKSLSNLNVPVLPKSESHLIKNLELMHQLANETSNVDPSPSNEAINCPKVYRVDVTQPTHGMQIALGIRDRVKKSKDLKNAWKRFVSKAASKFNGKSTTDKETEAIDLDKNSVISDGIQRDLSDEQGTSLTNFEKSKDRFFGSGLFRSPSNNSDVKSRCSRMDLDSGYMSADSNESKINCKKLYERFNFKIRGNASSDGGNPSIQVIKEQSSDELSLDCQSQGRTKKLTLEVEDGINVNVYSSDDERYSSEVSSETDDDFTLEEICESGAESVETHSVFFKNIRKHK